MNKCIQVKNAYDCCGCRNCENICPQKAITMKENEEGFAYPEVDKEKCINCGLCTEKCPWINKINRNKLYLKQPTCYAAKTKELSLQKDSSSGGMFGTLARYVLKSGGVVFGAEMNSNMMVKHITVYDEKYLKRILGSKYVSSDLGKIFEDVKQNLINKKVVLFSGVPCQISALLNFLGKDYDNLITVEVICHGVPSQKLFSKYIEYLEKKLNGKITKYYFRSKEAANWGTFKALVKYTRNGKEYTKKINADFDKYYKNFLDGNGYRESCYKCKFANRERNADFTLGDFWGIEKIMPDFIDYNGVSEIILNTFKSKEIFNNISQNIEFKETDYNEVIKYNGQLEKPTIRKEKRDFFYTNIDDKDYMKKQKIEKNVKSYIKIFFPEKMKFILKKMVNKKK